MNITDLEKQALENIINNDYGDVPDHAVWSWAIVECGCNDISKKQISGVISSLVKKGLVESGQTGNGGNMNVVVNLTTDGKKIVYELFHEKYDWFEKFKINYLGETNY